MIVDARVNPKYRVWVDGEEVTERCYFAAVDFYAKGVGVVELYRVDENGRYYRGVDNGPAKETRVGLVRVEPTT